MSSVTQTLVDGFPVYRGKVRDVYDLGDRVLLVATDRISAFDYILPNPVPDKGRILTGLTAFWMQYLKTQMGLEHGLLSTCLDDCPEPFRNPIHDLAGRVCLMRKLPVVQVECVARGYLAGSGYKEYQGTGTVCGNQLPGGLQLADKLPQVLFTPATKATTGHDENISFDRVVELVGVPVANALREATLAIFAQGAMLAESKSMILADTKFEFGLSDNKVVLVDEVLTPDSSRYWESATWRPGISPPSFDKQFVRDWLERSGWDKNSPPPNLPETIITKTRERYVEAFERITGRKFTGRVSSWEF
ncbi:MAG: phosphoribosylaminoimidazolesuccinocarboxamide synthase [Gemmataceae bacterium]|nr:phosphoribosylaminoimidazolesuccinocarboxamide synthase [Gemmataceae bacterium]